MKVEVKISVLKRLLANRFDNELFVLLFPYMSRFEIEVWSIIKREGITGRKIAIIKTIRDGYSPERFQEVMPADCCDRFIKTNERGDKLCLAYVNKICKQYFCV